MSLTAARTLSAELGVSRVLAEVLVRRGLADPAAAADFLTPDFRLHNPYLLHGVKEARRRIDRALQRDEHIVIHGDYDADGITATYVLHEVLKDMGASVSWRLPNRFVHGYGLSVEAIEEAAAGGAGLLITVDCGIRDLAAVARAGELGLDVVVTDHHLPGETLPDCIVVSPSLGRYPSPHLAGVGVAFKLAHALIEQPGEELVDVPLRLRRLLDVVALGTIADVVPLVGENRRLALMGLARLRSDRTPGMSALMEVAGVSPEEATAEAVSYRLAPRINAAGRLDDASLALHLLSAPDRVTAMQLALQLNECNAERQQLEQRMLEEAERRLPDPLPAGIVLADPDWHEGVAGIVASRLADRCHRPAILLCCGEEIAKGSGRSVPGFNLLDAVTASSQTLLAFGGHKAACGLRLRVADIDEFRETFQREVGARLRPEELVPALSVDAIVAGDELTLQLAEELERLAPYGEANRQVTLLLHGACVESPRLTRDGRHLRCRVRCDGACSTAIHFDFSDLDGLRDRRRFDVPLELVADRYNGSVSAQAKVKALVPLDGLPEISGAGESPGAVAAGSIAERDAGPDTAVPRTEGAEHRPAAGPVTDLCATGCSAACPRRITGRSLAGALLCAPDLEIGERSGACSQVAGDGRLIDLRGRPVLSGLVSLLAGDGSTLVLVADVGRRRPLLTRDVPLLALSARGVYLHGACAALRTDEVIMMLESGERLAVMADAETAARAPRLVSACSRVVCLDPPFSQAVLDGLCAALSPESELYCLWGSAEVQFSEKVLGRLYDLDAALRSLWRGLQKAQHDLGAALEAQLTAGDLLAAPLTLAAAVHTLIDLGLLAVGDGENLQSRAMWSVPTAPLGAGKTDRSASETYRAWRRRYDKKLPPQLLQGPST